MSDDNGIFSGDASERLERMIKATSEERAEIIKAKYEGRDYSPKRLSELNTRMDNLAPRVHPAEWALLYEATDFAEKMRAIASTGGQS